MSDLIRKSDVIQILKECNLDETLFEKDVFDKINNLQTAYDVAKVVEELKIERKTANNTYNSFNMDVDLGRVFGLEKAIEIVKQGGISDDVCEWIKYDYRTICPKNHDANNPYWRIPDNMDKLKYCPCCGKKILCKE